MSDSVTVLAPAKINLGLQILSRRSDGYHDLRSIFSTVGLFDEISVSKIDEKNRCVVECDAMELPEQNTITVAYKAFCVLTGIDCGVRVSIRKRIPAGGGLGGGSSDASSFLQSVDHLFGTGLDINSLSKIAEKVGSDVFFFTHALFADEGKRFSQFEPYAALVEGRGEIVNQIHCRKDFHVLLVFPDIGISTRMAYELVDGRTLTASGKIGFDFKEMYKKPVNEWRFANDFTIPICENYRTVAKSLSCLKKCNPDFADMSGSGSTLFGIFSKIENAVKAKEILGKEFKTVLV
jgi:4-diphosphocytidyl-2-C-methyl-D-erythritol kinase